MSTWRIGILLPALLLAACDPDPIMVTVERVIMTTETRTVNKGGDAGSDALTGAIVGGLFFGAPAAGAVVGAAGSEPPRYVNVTDIATCTIYGRLPDGRLAKLRAGDWAARNYVPFQDCITAVIGEKTVVFAPYIGSLERNGRIIGG